MSYMFNQDQEQLIQHSYCDNCFSEFTCDNCTCYGFPCTICEIYGHICSLNCEPLPVYLGPQFPPGLSKPPVYLIDGSSNPPVYIIDDFHSNDTELDTDSECDTELDTDSECDTELDSISLKSDFEYFNDYETFTMDNTLVENWISTQIPNPIIT